MLSRAPPAPAPAVRPIAVPREPHRQPPPARPPDVALPKRARCRARSAAVRRIRSAPRAPPGALPGGPAGRTGAAGRARRMAARRSIVPTTRALLDDLRPVLPVRPDGRAPRQAGAGSLPARLRATAGMPPPRRNRRPGEIRPATVAPPPSRGPRLPPTRIPRGPGRQPGSEPGPRRVRRTGGHPGPASAAAELAGVRPGTGTRPGPPRAGTPALPGVSAWGHGVPGRQAAPAP